MNPFLLSAHDRLVKWREFRQELPQLCEHDQLCRVAKWFAQCPTSNYSVEWDEPNAWPTPWDLLHAGYPCTTGVSYLMERTLVMSGWDPNSIHLVLVGDFHNSDQRMMPLVNDEWLLNYDVGDLVDFDTLRSNVVILSRYVHTENGYKKI